MSNCVANLICTYLSNCCFESVQLYESVSGVCRLPTFRRYEFRSQLAKGEVAKFNGNKLPSAANMVTLVSSLQLFFNKTCCIDHKIICKGFVLELRLHIGNCSICPCKHLLEYLFESEFKTGHRGEYPFSFWANCCLSS